MTDPVFSSFFPVEAHLTGMGKERSSLNAVGARGVQPLLGVEAVLCSGNQSGALDAEKVTWLGLLRLENVQRRHPRSARNLLKHELASVKQTIARDFGRIIISIAYYDETVQTQPISTCRIQPIK